MKRLNVGLLLLCSVPAFADSYSMAAITVKQPDAPIHIVAYTGLGEQMQIRNETMRAVVEVQIGWVRFVPPGCSEHPIKPLVKLAVPDPVVMSPGAMMTIRPYRIGSRATLREAQSLKAHQLYLLFGVVHVKFEDGTSWDYDLVHKTPFDDYSKQLACLPETPKPSP